MKDFLMCCIPFYGIGYAILTDIDFETDEYRLMKMGQVFLSFSMTGGFLMGLGMLIFK
jgi:hypothetical protein